MVVPAGKGEHPASDLGGRVALIIGGAAGIGLASSRALAERGATVVIADLDFEAAERAAINITVAGGDASAYCVDASSLDQLRAMFEWIDTKYQKLNVLFSNVGISAANGFDITEEQFDLAFDVNVKSHFFATNYATPLMRRGAPQASIIYMSSGGGLRPFGRSPLYSISKAAILMMTRTFARHLGPDGIRANALCPGPVETAFASRGDDAAYRLAVERWSKDIPLGRVAQPEDVSNVVAFLASDQSMYLTGLAIPVDGGFLA